MEDIESKLGAILGNPEMMQQIMSIAQNFQTAPLTTPATEESIGDIDFSTVQKISALIGKTGIDAQQKALLQALHPYLSSHRIQKLEKAMRAAKLAGMASVFLSSSGR